MTDNYVLALEKDRDTRLAELERCRSEVERFVGEVDRLTRERDEARHECLSAIAERNDWHFREEMARRSSDEWKARAEAAEAYNAALMQALRESCSGMRALEWVNAILSQPHPGAALLAERKRIAKTLNTMDVPSEADEAEKGRACDLAGRVELLASWGERGWRAYRKTKDSETALLERMRKQADDICRMAEAIEAWKGASGLERGGDPDGVRPDDLAREMGRLRTAEAETARLEEWCTSLREENDSVRRKEGALLERLRAADDVKRNADWLSEAVRQSLKGMSDADETFLGKALAAYDATKEGKVTIVTTTPAYQGVITLVPEEP